MYTHVRNYFSSLGKLLAVKSTNMRNPAVPSKVFFVFQLANEIQTLFLFVTIVHVRFVHVYRERVCTNRTHIYGVHTCTCMYTYICICMHTPKVHVLYVMYAM